MMKLTVNQAQDAAGLSSSARAGLATFAASRWHAGAVEGTNQSGDPRDRGGKAMAPMEHAAQEEVMYYSETAALRAAASRRGGQTKSRL